MVSNFQASFPSNYKFSASFASAKTIRAFVHTDLRYGTTHAPNFATSSQDFHIEFIKSVIDLKTS